MDDPKIIARLYSAVFRRAPDQAGLDYWVTATNNGFPVSDIAALFVSSPEFAVTYPSVTTTEARVQQLYRNILDRPGESAGVQYWVAAINNGFPLGDVVNLFANGPENIAHTEALAAPADPVPVQQQSAPPPDTTIYVNQDTTVSDGTQTSPHVASAVIGPGLDHPVNLTVTGFLSTNSMQGVSNLHVGASAMMDIDQQIDPGVNISLRSSDVTDGGTLVLDNPGAHLGNIVIEQYAGKLELGTFFDGITFNPVDKASPTNPISPHAQTLGNGGQVTLTAQGVPVLDIANVRGFIGMTTGSDMAGHWYLQFGARG